MWATTEFDIILGIDIHIVMIPAPPSPTPIPTPLPHPFTGIVFNPLDWFSCFNSVRVNRFPAASVASGGMPIPKHIPTPPGIPMLWAKGVVGNDAMMMMGGLTVSANGKAMTYAGLTVLSCSCIGNPPIKLVGQKMATALGYLPTSIVTPIPKGMPVLIGCPPTIDLKALGFAFLIKGVMSLAGSALRALGRKIMTSEGKIATALRNAYNKLPCFITGDPVDIVSGKVLTESIDFTFSGSIPLRWERVWFSTSNYKGPLGHGWHHCYDFGLRFDPVRQGILVRIDDGRAYIFPQLADGETANAPQDKLRLLRVGSHYLLKNTAGLIYRFSAPMLNDFTEKPLLSIENEAGFAIRFEYSPQNHLKKIIDSAERVFIIENDSAGRITAILAPNPHPESGYFPIVRYGYDIVGNLIEVFDAENRPYKYAYKRHLLVQHTNRNGLSFQFQYDGVDENAWCTRTWGDDGIYDHKLTYNKEERWTVVENSLGHRTKYFWNELNLVWKIIDPLGGERTFRYGAFAQKLSETDELGFTTYYFYDEMGNQTEVQHPDGAKESYVFDKNCRLLAATDANGGSWKWNYNDAGQVTERLNPANEQTSYFYKKGLLERIENASAGQTLLNYDAQQNLHQLVTPDGAESRWEFDSLGRCIQSFDPKGNRQERTFDRLNRVIKQREADGNTRQINYDHEGNIIRAQDKQHDIQFEYQGFNRLKARSEAGTKVKFAYNTEENLIGILNEHGFAYRFTYDARGEVQTESGFDSLTRRYLRDAAGRITEVKRPSNRFSKYDYDARGRVTEVNHSDGTWERFAYRADGELMEATNTHVAVLFERDPLGRVLKENQGGFWVESVFDKLGRRSEVHSSLGANLLINRNQMGDVERLFVEDGAEGWEAKFTRDKVGLEIERQLPGGVRSQWDRDEIGRPLKQEIHTAGNKRERTRTYKWDVNDRLKQLSDSQKGTTQFEHDAFGNLVSAQYGDFSFEFRMPDAVGNLFRSQDLKDRKYGQAGQLLESKGTRFEYDAEGNLIKKTLPNGNIWQYEWNGSGMLRRVTRPDGDVVTFTYDALGRRRSKRFRNRTTRWVWDGNQPLHEWVDVSFEKPENSTSPAYPKAMTAIRIRRRDEQLVSEPSNAPPNISEKTKEIAIPLPSELTTWLFEPETFTPLARLRTGNNCAIITDHLGTPVSMYDDEGRRVWDMNLSIYGQARQIEGLREDCPFRYPGQYEDVETGLYYNRFRYYDSEAGMYVSQDPIRVNGGILLYGYPKNPNQIYDPLGLSGCDQSLLYRFDTRSPEQIRAAGGFNAWGTDMDLLAHANGTNIGNKTSGLVSTTISEAKAIEFSRGKKGFVYVIQNPGNGIDVNSVLGGSSPFAEEMEIAIPKQIPFGNILNIIPAG
jgi:RHS repeat-associated protein